MVAREDRLPLSSDTCRYRWGRRPPSSGHRRTAFVIMPATRVLDAHRVALRPVTRRIFGSPTSSLGRFSG